MPRSDDRPNIVDARVDYKGRLHLTMRGLDKMYTTAILEVESIDAGVSYDVISSYEPGEYSRPTMYKGAQSAKGTLSFSMPKAPVISNRRPKRS